MDTASIRELFFELYEAKNENDVDTVVARHPAVFAKDNWHPIGGNESNFGVIENQQSNPVAAIVEKLTNSIDAILMRRCIEAGVDPRSPEAPRSVSEAVERFFPEHKNWDLSSQRRKQAESIQIIADSYPRDTNDTSLIIYDDGEGQHPHKFEDTFLSLLRGNKNEIHFVQGKYNMGGSGAIVFCGKKRYQLIASRRFDGGLLGFTLIRKHPLSEYEAKLKKNTWYEYLKVDGLVPAFEADELDLRLYNRKFTGGTIIKLYSYDLKGNKHIRRDLSRSINEFLYEPALPIYAIESSDRYPNDNALQTVIFGLKRLLDGSEYIEETFSEHYTERVVGDVEVKVHVFKTRAKGKTAGETKKTIQNEYFKNNMAVLFSMNGQVHAHYTSEFITRSLRFNLLRDFLLIHVDCTAMNYNFRSELFMASRDRLKDGEEAKYLRQMLARELSDGRLKEIYKSRKDSISVDQTDSNELIRTFASSLPISGDLKHLLGRAFKLDGADKPSRSASSSTSEEQPREKEERLAFNPQRYPSFFKANVKTKGNKKVVAVPLNGRKIVRFDTDVEDAYFDRIEDPGELKIAVMGYTPNDNTGGNRKGTVNDIRELFNVKHSSPNQGTIKIVLQPSGDVSVGDEVQIAVDLTSPGMEFSEILWVKISEPTGTQTLPVPKPEEELPGLPQMILVYETMAEGGIGVTWASLQDVGIDVGWNVVMHPELEGDILNKIYINMDSAIFKNYISSIRNITVEQKQVAERRYMSAVYFHSLFLYIITKNRGYSVQQVQDGNAVETDLTDYLKDVFSSHYASFLLTFGTQELMENLG